MKLYEALTLTFTVNIINVVIAVIPVYILWNWVVPDLFSLHKIGLFQALGLITLIQFLIKPTFFEINEN